MFGRRKKGPDKAFSHSEHCKIQAADPTVSIEWSEVERGHWRAVCQCGAEDYYELVADRVRSDPLDAKTSRHAGQCEFASATDGAVLRVVLKVKDGAGGDYWWVECGARDTLAGSVLRGESRVTTKLAAAPQHGQGLGRGSPEPLTRSRDPGMDCSARGHWLGGREICASGDNSTPFGTEA